MKERPCVLASISLNNVDQEIELMLNVWDVDREKSLMPEFKSSSLGRFKRGSIPLTQLVARRVGEDLRDIEVAYALGDDKLRVWNSAKHEVEKYSSDYQIYALAWLDEQRLVTAGQWNDAISLQFWARANPKECFKKSNRDGWHLYPYETPQALAILSREKGSKRAVILLQGRQKRKGLVEAIYRIQVAKLGEDLSCQWLDSMELGSVPNEGPYLPPPVCASPRTNRSTTSSARNGRVHPSGPVHLPGRIEAGGRLRARPRGSHP